MLVIASTLLTLWGNTCLEIVFRLAVFKFLATVKLAGLLFKVLFHQVNVVLIVLFIYAWITPYQYTELVEGLSYELALLFHLDWILPKESHNINDWYSS
jgi:hypothetical protein